MRVSEASLEDDRVSAKEAESIVCGVVGLVVDREDFQERLRSCFALVTQAETEDRVSVGAFDRDLGNKRLVFVVAEQLHAQGNSPRF